MDKEHVVWLYNGLLLGYQKEWNNAICRNMDELRDYHTKWRKSDRESQIYAITYMCNLEKIIQMNLCTKQKQSHRLQKQTHGHQRENRVMEMKTLSIKPCNLEISSIGKDTWKAPSQIPTERDILCISGRKWHCFTITVKRKKDFFFSLYLATAQPMKNHYTSNCHISSVDFLFIIALPTSPSLL